MMDEARPTPTRGAPITLDRVRYLRYSLATRKKMRAELGDAATLKADVEGEKLPQLLLFGLREDDPQLTIEQVEDLIDLEHLPEVMEAVVKAMGGKKSGTVCPKCGFTMDPLKPEPAPATVEPSAPEAVALPQ